MFGPSGGVDNILHPHLIKGEGQNILTVSVTLVVNISFNSHFNENCKIPHLTSKFVKSAL